MKIKTAELTGAALDWAVTVAEGRHIADPELIEDWQRQREFGSWSYSTDWAQGGPIIEREKLDVCPYDLEGRGWRCNTRNANYTLPDELRYSTQFGPTPLIAACRCYVASKLGDEVEVPDDLY